MLNEKLMDYNMWEATVPAVIRNDVLWKQKVYRLGLYVAEIGWQDVSKLVKDRRTISIADQLNRALGSISANIAEGYSRGSGKDRCRFYEYALGSAREARDWYYKARHILGEDEVLERMEQLSQIARLLLTMLPSERDIAFREDQGTYEVGSEHK
ncbi:MAG: four helix bundle protein [bacterium]|jgi:four helix bundle protein